MHSPATLMQRHDIPSLTGLRGIAAWLVVMAHTSSFLVAQEPSWLDSAWRTGANLGMTTFFVLSGFVIHYNYSSAIAVQGAPAIGSFLIARFARLYPLYLLTLVVAIAIEPSIVHESAFAPWCWRYLTMTQDWTPTLIDGRFLGSLYVGSAWSISAEVGLYLFFLLVAVPLDRLRSVRLTLCIIGALILAGTVVIAGYANGAWLTTLPLPGWWFYASPIARLPEFLLGALIAQAYLIGRDPPNLRWLGVAGLGWIVAAFAAGYIYPSFLLAFGFAPGVAALMFFLASQRSRAAALVEAPAMRILGDASYSTYMLHGYVLWYVMKQTPREPGLLRVAMAWALLVLISVLVYTCFEAPTRRWIRALFGRPRRPAVGTAY
jgi:peptidoglycan/LPS O-acetylase OafA/YrhL